MGTAIAISTSERFGGCPRCGECHRLLGVGSDFWGMCWAHQVRWYAGWDLFPAPEHEPVEEWLSNDWWLSNFELVSPIYPADEQLVVDRPMFCPPGRISLHH